MLILHEIIEDEAKHIAKTLSDIYKIPIELQKADLSKWFKPLPEFNGYWDSAKKISANIKRDTPNNAVMILTHRDLYYGNHSKDDEWIFGYCMNNIQVVSNARMKGENSQPIDDLTVSYDKYMKRFTTLAVHELGHDVIQAQHMKKAYWVNASNNIKYPLGKHCTNNKCVMYEVVDIITPAKAAGYLLIGKEKKYDAGLDEHMQRIYDTWFCSDCQDSMFIPVEYKAKISR